jgi:hypothetical protein
MKSHILKILIVISLTSPFLQNCKKECGCAAEPYKTVSNVEAKYYYDITIIFLEDTGTSYSICNLDIVPEEIQLKAESELLDGINVIVSGKLHEGCEAKMESIIPNGITLTEIKLSDNQQE